MNDVEQVVMYEFLSVFTEKDYFLPISFPKNDELLSLAIAKNFVKEWLGPIGSSYVRSYSLTPRGRLYLLSNT